jgi:outer membrane protein insertion porin family
VNVETLPVAGTADQVDVVVTVTEKNTAAFFGVGYPRPTSSRCRPRYRRPTSSARATSCLPVNNGSVNRSTRSRSWTPLTVDGVAAGIDIFRRDVDTSELVVTSTRPPPLTGSHWHPLTEYDAIRFGVTGENTSLSLDPSTAPPRYLDFVNIFGEKTNTVRTNIGYSRDSRDSLTYPTKGWLTDLALEVGVPPGDLKYYRASIQQQYLWTPRLVPWLTLLANAELGYADGYGDRPLPFFKNFYAGGVGSVRGFESSSLGPRDANGDVLGAIAAWSATSSLFPCRGSRTRACAVGIRRRRNVQCGQKVAAGTSAFHRIAVSWDSPVGRRSRWAIPSDERVRQDRALPIPAG